MGLSGAGRGAVAGAATDGAGTTRPLRAFAWMMGAIASFTVMAVSGRAVQEEFNSFQLMAWRSAIGLVIVVAIILLSRQGFAQVRTRQPWLHVQRNIFHFMGQNAWFMALMMLPLAQVVALEFTSPIWVVLLAALMLGEKLTARKLLAIAVGFAGMLIVARPGVEPLQLGHAVALLAALGFALNTIYTKRIMAHDTVLCVLFWMTASQTLMGVLLGLPGGFPLPSVGLLPWLVMVGVAGLTAHYSLGSALGHAPASIVAPMEFLRLPVLALIGALFYAEAVALAVFLGGAIILAANLINMGVGLPRWLRPPGRG